jgi:hypothetical protein
VIGRKHPDAALEWREAAIKAVVAVVSHDEEVGCRNSNRPEVIAWPMLHLVEHCIGRSTRQGLNIGGIEAICLA